MVAPFAAGSPVDLVGRLFADRMRISLAQPIVVENVSGAAGTLAVGRVVRAAADGYTISLGNVSSHVLSGAVYYMSVWNGLWVPKGTPNTVIASLSGAATDAMADPAVRNRLGGLGLLHSAARSADTGSAWGIPQGRDREVVVHHQGSQYQGRVVCGKSC